MTTDPATAYRRSRPGEPARGGASPAMSLQCRTHLAVSSSTSAQSRYRKHASTNRSVAVSGGLVSGFLPMRPDTAAGERP
ncbi:hypothetical protein [Spirillospora sp. NPDC048819]|uniref:hypothetical protein n=1 Tax=Spirillospora sp. NPDC048819 TaxID=3155268 RepID=UPI0033DBB36F